MIILDSQNQTHVLTVSGQDVTFTVRPGTIADLDQGFNQLMPEDQDKVANLKVGRALMLQRIIAWEGVYVSETEAAPCTLEYLSNFFGRFPGAFWELSEKVRERDNDLEKN